MLRKRVFFFVALIVFSFNFVPAGAVQAENLPAGSDSYEPDNSAGQAKVIASGTSQVHKIIPMNDFDWMKFTLTTTSAVLLETTGPYDSDTRITLYNGVPSPLEFSDDEGVGFYSLIDRLCSKDPLPPGTYYVQVEEWGNNAEIPAYDIFFQSSPCPAQIVDIYVGAEREASSAISLHQGTRRSIGFLNTGPLKIINTGGSPLMAAERVIYKVNGVNTSFTEMMALPDNQLDTLYWLPWYNNVDLDTQLRFANISGTNASVNVYIGGALMTGSPFSLAPGASIRRSFTGVNNGPVKIQSTVPIVAAERVIYKVNGVPTSFSEMMGLPDGQVDTHYWLPWYNNVNLDTQLRIANVGTGPASVHISIGGAAMPNSPLPLAAGVSTRVSYPALDAGPVEIVSDQPIVVAERVIYKVNNVNTSFSESMALPNSQLDTSYWLPWYNNVDLDTQLRFANVGSTNASVNVYIGGILMPGSPFSLGPGQSTRQSFNGINRGPVQIVSTQKLVAAERVIYRINGVNTSFSEMMALPNSQLNTVFWLPWYNNVDLDTQLRFGMP